MAFDINFNEEKNQLLKATRGVSFDEVIGAISKGDLLADIAHPSKSRPNQRVYIVRIEKYAYAVPYVINVQKNEIFLKTAYPSSALTKKYIKGDSHE
ncbi:MAG TPA: toxin [Patescibacteria group bacterium]|nr:toxin [Patescibacteria group bacterium]